MDDTPIAPAATYPTHSATGHLDPTTRQPLAGTPLPGHVAPQEGRAQLEGQPFGGERRGVFKRIGSALAGLGALAAKFGAALKALLVALPNAKLFVTAGTALVSVVLYSMFWGWWFAVGFVALLFVHEMGHVIALRREGIKASAPMFVPFMGALITSRSLGDNALAEARVGLAGPVLGSLGAAAVAVAGALLHSDALLALAYVGFLINLFNLLPVVPLDGGRAMAAMAPWMWFVGFGGLLVLAFTLPSNPVLWIIVLFGGFELYRRWQARKSGSPAQAAYYRVAPRHRLLVGLVYIGLAAALAFGMGETHILSTGGHSFNL
ncbi:MAG TPA: site-2 protease family protein [Solirubrobacteraceae bacterium]|nr:site-2 protease family protein [Solirubrobacteraceae bacterium]